MYFISFGFVEQCIGELHLEELHQVIAFKWCVITKPAQSRLTYIRANLMVVETQHLNVTVLQCDELLYTRKHWVFGSRPNSLKVDWAYTVTTKLSFGAENYKMEGAFFFFFMWRPFIASEFWRQWKNFVCFTGITFLCIDFQYPINCIGSGFVFLLINMHTFCKVVS